MLHHPFVDEIINYDKKAILRSPGELYKFLKKVRSRPYDLAIVPATVSLSTTSNLIARSSSAIVRIGPGSLEGLKNTSGYCFTEKVQLGWNEEPHRHQALRNLDILAPLKLSSDDLSCVIGVTEIEKSRACETLAPLRKDRRILIGLHPGAGKIPNRWKAENFARLANNMAEKHRAGIIITEGPMDAEPIREVAKYLTCQTHFIKNRPIREVAALLNEIDLYITNDTGVMHIAGAVSANVMALFGPTDPLQWAPAGEKNRYLASNDGNIDSISLAGVEQTADEIIGDILSSR